MSPRRVDLDLPTVLEVEDAINWAMVTHSRTASISGRLVIERYLDRPRSELTRARQRDRARRKAGAA